MYLGYEMVEGKRTNHVIAYNGPSHMLTIGPTRSGKSRRLLIPNLLYETGRSMLVVDIKGELAAYTAAHRLAKAGRGGSVVALDPFGVLPGLGVNIPRVGFNPMSRLNPKSDDFVDDAMRIAEALVQVKPQDRDPHWAESAQDLVAGLIMLVKCTAKDKATLGMVRKEISNSSEEMQATVKIAIENSIHEAISNKLRSFEEIAPENRELASIMSNARTQTRFLDSPHISRNLEGEGVDFRKLKTSRATIYLVMPPKLLVMHAKWLRLIISSAMTTMQEQLEVPPDRRDIEVLFMLDEFPQLGRLEPVETAVSLNAGYGVKVWAAVQHLGQLQEHYGNNWETFLSASCVTAFAPRDLFTRDHLTKLIGTGMKGVPSTSHSSSGESSQSNSLQKDDLMSAHDWRKMVMGEQWTFIPDDDGQQLQRVWSPDLNDLPEVKSGAIRPGL
jgi:type IV secretion system protein VirD4